MAILSHLLYVVACCVWLGVAQSLDASAVRTHIPSGIVGDTHFAIRHGLAAARLEKRKDFRSNASLSKSWSGATLLSVQMPEDTLRSKLNASASLLVTCTSCYVAGNIGINVQIKDDFNITQTIESTKASVDKNIQNLTDTFGTYLVNYTRSVFKNLQDGIDASDFILPTFPFAFDIDVPEIPETNLRIQFDDMEVYLELNMILPVGATYEINLYSSLSPIGIRVGPVLQFGVVAAVDLILAAESIGAIEIGSGFHIKLDDGILLDIALFGDKVSKMNLKGGKFEFLPVKVEIAGIVISAILRIGIHCGIEVVPEKLPAGLFLPLGIGAGMEVAVVAHVAEFITNITHTPDDKECKLKVIQQYNLALGAIAGASIEVNAPSLKLPRQTWGPVIERSTAIFTTTLAEVCAISRSSVPTQASMMSSIKRRQALTTTILTATVTTSGVSCIQLGLANCPASLQKTTQVTQINYHTTAVTSGAKPGFPETTFANVGSRKPFGNRVKTIRAISGSPTPYTASPSPTGVKSPSGTTFPNEVVRGRDVKLIAGLSVGLGIPTLAAIAGIIIFIRRRGKTDTQDPDVAMVIADPDTINRADEDAGTKTKDPSSVPELRR